MTEPDFSKAQARFEEICKRLLRSGLLKPEQLPQVLRVFDEKTEEHRARAAATLKRGGVINALLLLADARHDPEEELEKLDQLALAHHRIYFTKGFELGVVMALKAIELGVGESPTPLYICPWLHSFSNLTLLLGMRGCHGPQARCALLDGRDRNRVRAVHLSDSDAGGLHLRELLSAIPGSGHG